jgi:omega-amidase
MDPLKAPHIALLQAQLKWREPETNRRHLQQMLEQVEGPVDIAILPETFTTGFLGDPGVPEEGMDGATVRWMQELAAGRQCVVTGSVVINTPGGRRNRLLWAEPGGQVHFYDKRHLFAFGGENERYVAGRERVVWAYRGWRVCPQICYDIRFPVWCRNRADYDLLLVVANWPKRRVDAWSALLRARAIENQCYVAAVNRVGEDGNGIRYPGQSVVHDPLGAELLRLDSAETAGVAELDLEALMEIRRKLPFQADADDFTLAL